MKILYITHLHPPEDAPLESIGGMQRVSLQLVRVLSENPDVQIKTLKLETSWGGIGIKTTFFLLDLFVSLPEIVRQWRPDVILFSSMVTASLAPFVRNKIEVPMITINHGHDVTLNVSVYQWYIRKVFKALDGVISVSSATRDASLARGLGIDKGTALPNGFDSTIDMTSISKTEAKRELSEALGTDLSNRKILLTTGRLIRRKGHQWFIESVLPEIKSEVVYVVIGDGPELHTVLQTAEKSESIHQIFIMGRQTDEVLQLAYRAADLFVMPNIRVPGDMEGFGVVMLEANIAETPVIASDLEGIKDVISNGKNGYRIEPYNHLEFAHKVDFVLNTELSSLSKLAREFVKDNFTWEQVSLKYLNYLKQVVHESH